MIAMSGDTAGCRKKYIIERKDGEKVVARKQGITTSTCLTARPLSGDQSSSTPSQTCKQVICSIAAQGCPSVKLLSLEPGQLSQASCSIFFLSTFAR